MILLPTCDVIHFSPFLSVILYYVNFSNFLCRMKQPAHLSVESQQEMAQKISSNLHSLFIKGEEKIIKWFAKAKGAWVLKSFIRNRAVAKLVDQVQDPMENLFARAYPFIQQQGTMCMCMCMCKRKGIVGCACRGCY